MKAVVVPRFGLEHAHLDDVPPPKANGSSVRIRVQSAGVSFANLLVIEGKHQNRWEPPFIPGTDVAGTVIECGPDVRLFKPGDRVAAGVRCGGFAEEVVAHENNVFALPDQVDFDAAVHFPTIYATAYAALTWRARIQPHETLLVHGAAGGSGLAAIEIGKVLGARVIASTSSAAKLAAVAKHGADICIDYKDGGFRDAVLAATNGRGADVIFDPVGGNTFDESLRCIAPDGRIIPMGFACGTIPTVAANIALVKNITVIGLYWGYYMGWARQLPPPEMYESVRASFSELFEWTASGLLRPYTNQAYSIDRFQDALGALSNQNVIGKNILKP